MKAITIRTIVMVFAVLLIAKQTIAQQKDSAFNSQKADSVHSYKNPYIPPKFPGGPNAYQEYIDKNLIYPKEALAAKAEGEIIVHVLVFPNGELAVVEVSQDHIGHGCAEEAKRLINNMPKWIPGSMNGKTIIANHNLHIYFSLAKKSNYKYPPPQIVEGEDMPAPQQIVEAPQPPKIVYDTNYVSEYFDEPPMFPGGRQAYETYLQEHIKYPQQALDAQAHGTIYVSLVISKTGQITDVKIFKDKVGYGCGDEALRVARGMPPWRYGKVNGSPVNCRYVIPVKFVLPVKK
jgi:TonB family protein